MEENKKDTIKDIATDINKSLSEDLISKLTIDKKNDNKPRPRLSFTEDPVSANEMSGIYKSKRDMLPDKIIKQIRNKNLVVANILRSRANTISMFGNIRKDRFDIGIELLTKKELLSFIDEEDSSKINDRRNKTLKAIINCGQTSGLKKNERMNLSEFLNVQTQNGLSFGRFATEFIKDPDTGEVHRFRPVDVSTIFPLSEIRNKNNKYIRDSSIPKLKNAQGIDITPEDLETNEKFQWVQVVNGIPSQVFTEDEMSVKTLYPNCDIETSGFPITPLETAITSVTTYLDIETYNKLYFQNGRAAKGMLVVKSDSVLDQGTLNSLEQQYMASINSVNNSFRTPIFSMSNEDSVTWVATESGSKDGEFQFLYDQTIRNILSAFNMSPDEIPGYSHLSKGTNSQGLSESNNQFKLIAARDTGIRPLIIQMQDFLNHIILPAIDPELAQLCHVVLGGLDSQTSEQESARLQQNMPIHYTYNDVLRDVEKDSISSYMCGDIPFNERLKQLLDQYVNVGKIQAELMGNLSAINDPLLNYKRDPFYFQWLQFLQQTAPEHIQALLAWGANGDDMLEMLIKDYLEEEE